MKDKCRLAMERFHMLSQGDCVIVGLSGGADSCALLHYLCDLREELSLHITAVHINHMIRGEEAERDAAAALYAEADPESAANVEARRQATDEMIAEANAEIEALRQKGEETDAAIKEAEKTIGELQDVEGYEYYRAIYDEYVEGREYVEELLSGN